MIRSRDAKYVKLRRVAEESRQREHPQPVSPRVAEVQDDSRVLVSQHVDWLSDCRGDCVMRRGFVFFVQRLNRENKE